MRRLPILTLLLAALLCSSCATGLSAIRDDIAIVAAKAKAGVEKAEAVAAAASAKVDAAVERSRAAGLNVDGTEADFVDSVKKNPGKAWSVGLSTLAMTLFGVWQRNRAKTATRALTASVDAAEGLDPAAATAFKTAASQSTHMGAAETALIATLKAR